jgi:hypothetical protein
LRVAAINDEPVFTRRVGRKSLGLIGGGKDELVFHIDGRSIGRRYRRCISAVPPIRMM